MGERIATFAAVIFLGYNSVGGNVCRKTICMYIEIIKKKLINILFFRGGLDRIRVYVSFSSI